MRKPDDGPNKGPKHVAVLQQTVVLDITLHFLLTFSLQGMLFVFLLNHFYILNKNINKY